MSQSTTAKLDGRPSATNELQQKLENKEKSFIFPGDLVEVDNWMCFRINKQKLMAKNDFPIDQDIARIFLPVPIGLATQYGHGYNSEGLGVTGMLAAQGGGKARSMVDQIMAGASVGDVAGKAGTGAIDSIKKLGAGGVAKEAAGIGASVTAGSGLADNAIAKGAMAGAGVARNPYMALVYDSPAFREHAFSWKLVSRNLNEAVALQNIITLFKYHAAPSKTGSGGGLPHFYNYPEQFDIDFRHEKTLYNIGPSVLKTIGVNYHPDGPMYHRSLGGEKYPVAVQLDLSFQEVSVITKEDINGQNR